MEIEYANKSSGVKAYEIGDDFIWVRFKRRNKKFRYHLTRIGQYNLERMKELAIRGRGLSTFINQHDRIKNGYDMTGY